MAALCVAPVLAADISAETMGYLFDVLAPSSQQGSATAPAAAQALDILRRERLLAGGRPVTTPPDLVESYGKALMLGSRASQFAGEIAAVHNAIARGGKAGLEDAIKAVYVKAGRTAPEGETLERLVKAVRGADSGAPEESERHTLSRDGYTVEIANLRGAGQFRVDVVRKNAAGEAVRTVFAGERVTRPNGAGRLESRIEPQPPRTLSESDSARLRERLNGVWTDQDGQRWTIAGTGPEILASADRTGKPALDYRGRFVLGDIDAVHWFEAQTDMDDTLPNDVRAQLVGWQPRLGFRIRLSAGDSGDRLYGTWSSQHVTYGAMDHAVSRVHDPYDLTLRLTRARVRGTAALP